MDKLGINLGYLIAYVINILIMLAVLWLAAIGPLTKMMQQRRERIAEGINQARKAQEALASAENDRQAILDEARVEAQKIVAEARSRAEDAAGQVKADASEEAKRVLAQAAADADNQRQAALADMRDQIIPLSMAAANHLIGASLDEKKQKSVVTDFFTAVPAEARALGGDVTVVTAIPLTSTEQKKFESSLEGSVSFHVDPSILGGVVIRSGAQEVDNSFRGQLAGMRSSLS